MFSSIASNCFVPLQTGVSEQNGQGADSDSEALITNETKKDDDGTCTFDAP